MKFATRNRPTPALPGVAGTVRADRRTRRLLPRLRPGDLALIDHVDLDRATAQALVDAEVGAVLNASAMISGRYPNLGPAVLAAAGIPMVDLLGPELFVRVKDGAAARLVDDALVLGEETVLTGRLLDADAIAEQLDDARQGLAHQLESFTHNSSEFLRREQDLLLHGQGVPLPSTSFTDRAVVVVAPGADHEAELRLVRRFVKEMRPVLVGIDSGADVLLAQGMEPDVVVVSAAEEQRPSAKALRAATDVVVRVDRGASSAVTESFSKLGLRPLRFESSATAEDAALILADAGHASLIVGVGMHATLTDFLDRQNAGIASTYLTRLKLGPKLVDATAVPTLYSGRVRPRDLFTVGLVGLLALFAAIGTTPVGQEWAEAFASSTGDLVDYLQGIFS
ncbi:putative cytokinetic ring protein SteA [Nocardioides campestrisoli]|uniref:putative cytokinetic ring protein SteA n=1 Tax=Nocardioides campestrisoli TaxID=2736757 RepID=UPI0015E6A7AB|nr:putative cytokinetic ring protein SteA [Nocardioides campestrisoli]